MSPFCWIQLTLEIAEALLDDPDQSMLEFVGFHKVFIRAEREPLRFCETPKLSVQQFPKPPLFVGRFVFTALPCFLPSSPHCPPLRGRRAALPRGNLCSIPLLRAAQQQDAQEGVDLHNRVTRLMLG